MTDHDSKAPMLDLFVFETSRLLEQLERLVLESEKSGGLEPVINEIFRIMHTIKGSSAMMLFDSITLLAHSVEDVFYYLRESKPQNKNYAGLTDMVLGAVDFFKGEIHKLETGVGLNGDCSVLVEDTEKFLATMKEAGPESDNLPKQAPQNSQQPYYISAKKSMDDDGGTTYQARITFDEECGMENIRAFTLVHELNQFADNIKYTPHDILENDSTAEIIRQNGFAIFFSTKNSLDTMEAFFAKTMFLKDVHIEVVGACPAPGSKVQHKIDLDSPLPDSSLLTTPAVQEDFLVYPVNTPIVTQSESAVANHTQNFISVNIAKMDMLMDLVGELVIAEAMVTQNQEIKGLALDNFHKSARQLRKITGELQDIVMSVRMVPLAPMFQKMQRIVRDMTKKLNKRTELEILGGETEVDKSIIEHISDPLMHLVRNAVDHGIELTEERIAKGKSPTGKITLEAKNTGGDVLIIVKDDGGGLNKEKILKKAHMRGLLPKSDAILNDREIFACILHPGFSTKDTVTEFSGRGVGMDVVGKNIEKVGGSISVDSVDGEGTTISIRIPLTLAIVEGMTVKVGNAIYTIPITAVKESFQLKEQNVIKDADNNEMILIRGECYPILRLYERFRVKTQVTDLAEGIVVMVEAGSSSICLFADSLLGQQQVVIKALPRYIKKTKGIAGCTLLGDGGVSLILDVAGLVHH